MTTFLNHDQFLPGMGVGSPHGRLAEPHEQTEAQFHNRPDVFVHGRYVHLLEPNHTKPPVIFEGRGRDFHAGTEASAHERLDNHGAPFHGHEARFYHGRVDPAKMKNSPMPGEWEKTWDPEERVPGWSNNWSRAENDPGRRPDQIDEWKTQHHDTYYRNDYEDAGSTSVIIGTDLRQRREPNVWGGTRVVTEAVPTNFTTWRSSVSDALRSGKHVPAHVRASYRASGGAEGNHSNVHAHYEAPRAPNATHRPTVADRYEMQDQEITGLHEALLRRVGKPAF